MITNILLSTLFACSVVTSAPINNYHNQKQNAVNENAFVLDDNNYFVTDENVFYRYIAQINQPIPNGMEELIDALYMIPRPPAGKSLIEFKTNSNNLSAYVGRWYNITKYFDDDNNANYYILLQKDDQSYTSVSAYTLLYENNLRPSQYYAMRFFENIDYDTHKDNFNGMMDKNGNGLNRQLRPILQLGTIPYTFEYLFNNEFIIHMVDYTDGGNILINFNSLLISNSDIELYEKNENGYITSSLEYYNYYSDEPSSPTEYHPAFDLSIYMQFSDIFYVSIGTNLFNFFENYIFISPNENYEITLIIDLLELFYQGYNYELYEHDEIEIDYTYDGLKFDKIDILLENDGNNILLTVILSNTKKNLNVILCDYYGSFNENSFLNYLGENNISQKNIIYVDTILNDGSFNFIRTLYTPILENDNTNIGIFNIFDLLSGGLLGIGAILSVMVLPGITIGMLLFLPFLALILFFIISLFKR